MRNLSENIELIKAKKLMKRWYRKGKKYDKICDVIKYLCLTLKA